MSEDAVLVGLIGRLAANHAECQVIMSAIQVHLTAVGGVPLEMPTLFPVEVTFLIFPTVGVGAHTYVLSERQVDEWAMLFPTLDVHAESRKALAWIKSHDAERKTVKGMPKFLVAWLSRATDSRRSSPLPLERPSRPQWKCPHRPPCNHPTPCNTLQQLGR